MKVAVVTPTIGSEHLWKCVESVQEQDYDDITHYIFIDGKQFKEKVEGTLFSFSGYKATKTIQLEENVGKGWYGHRVYAACSFLVNADVICYLDEDNWIDCDHISSLLQVIKNGNDWAYSLRKIVNKDSQFICNDNCESLGLWPVYSDNKQFHIDTSCYAVKRDIATKIGHSWYAQWGADRIFLYNLSTYFSKFNCNFKYTLNYRLEGNEGSVTSDFFLNGNKINKDRYKTFPWVKD